MGTITGIIGGFRAWGLRVIWPAIASLMAANLVFTIGLCFVIFDGRNANRDGMGVARPHEDGRHWREAVRAAAARITDSEGPMPDYPGPTEPAEAQNRYYRVAYRIALQAGEPAAFGGRLRSASEEVAANLADEDREAWLAAALEFVERIDDAERARLRERLGLPAASAIGSAWKDWTYEAVYNLSRDRVTRLAAMVGFRERALRVYLGSRAWDGGPQLQTMARWTHSQSGAEDVEPAER